MAISLLSPQNCSISQRSTASFSNSFCSNRTSKLNQPIFCCKAFHPSIAFKNSKLRKTHLSDSSEIQTHRQYSYVNRSKRNSLGGAMAELTSNATQTINPNDVSIMINGGSGKMGQAVASEAVNSGLKLVPFALAGPNILLETINIQGIDVAVHPLEERDRVLDLALEKYPNLIIVDYTLPAGVNDNAEWYCKKKIPFVMGTTGGDRQRLIESVRESKNYAVIAPQMGKQVVAFLAAMEYLAETFPGAYSGYNLTAFESHQSSKVDVSGTAKEVVSSFQKLGIDFSFDQIQKVREKKEQVEMMKVPEEYLNGHAFHTYQIASPDKTVSFEFQHNVCGRNIYAQGTVDAVLFLAKKIAENNEQTLFNMIDVLKGGAMR